MKRRSYEEVASAFAGDATLKEAAKVLGVSPNAASRLADNAGIKRARRRGPRPRWIQADVQAAFAVGATLKEVAEALGASQSTAARLAAAAGIERNRRRGPRPGTRLKRTREEVLAAFSGEPTLAEAGRHLGVCRERARQLAKKYGIERSTTPSQDQVRRRAGWVAEVLNPAELARYTGVSPEVTARLAGQRKVTLRRRCLFAAMVKLREMGFTYREVGVALAIKPGNVCGLMHEANKHWARRKA